METFARQIYEEFPIAGDYVNVLETGETLVLATSSVLAEDKDGTDVSDTVLDQATKEVSGSQLKILVRAGSVSASPYKITFRAVTSNGYKWEIDAEMVVF